MLPPPTETESLVGPKFNLAHFFATISRHTSLILHFCHKYPVRARDTRPDGLQALEAGQAESQQGRDDIAWAGQSAD